MTGRRIAIFLVFVFVIGLVIYGSLTARNILLESVDYLGVYFNTHKILSVFIFFSISVLAVLLSPFSSIPFVPSAILAWGNFLTFMLLISAWMLGSVFAFFLGSYSREKIIRHFLSFGKVEFYKKRINPRAQFWLVLLFRLALPSEVAGYTLGVVRYDFKKYLLATFLSELPIALFSIYSSSILLSGKFLLFAGAILAGSLVLYAPYRVFQKKIKSGI